MIRWCKNCEYPTKNKVCKLCNDKTTVLSKNAVPVFIYEKNIISYIINKDVTDKTIWNLGKNYYLIDGNRKDINYSKIMNDEKELANIRKNIFESNLKGNVEDFNNFIKGNEEYLKDLVVEADYYIKDVVRTYKQHQLIISWSGGKDSTVISDLVTKSLSFQKILHIFGDTTLEFPTTYEYFERFKKNNIFIPFICTSSDKGFFELCNIFGPPSRIMRWCCSIFKTGPISREFNQTISGNILTFYGIRRSESASRSKYRRTEKSPKILRQIVSAPIIDWDDYDVWLYIISQNLDFNKAYEYGFRRVGCLYCPNNSMWSEFIMSIYFKEEYQKWKKYLYSFANKIGKQDYIEYIDNGNWKARQGGYGLDNSMVQLENIDCNLYDNAQNYILKKPVTNDIVQYLKPLGDMQVIEEQGEYKVTISHLERDDIIFQWMESSAIIKVIFTSDKNIYLMSQRVECQLRKYQACILCSACDSVCPLGAISTVDRYIVSDNCIHCGKCISYFTGGCLMNKTLYKSKI